jgi:DASH complex subunit ASK1
MSFQTGVNRRISMAPPKGFRDLEEIEMEITMTLQQIDRNFAHANKVISETILPHVKKYGDESGRLWQSSKFWKEFMESSAEIQLTAYEEDAAMLEDDNYNYDTLMKQNSGLPTDQAMTSENKLTRQMHELSTPVYIPQSTPNQTSKLPRLANPFQSPPKLAPQFTSQPRSDLHSPFHQQPVAHGSVLRHQVVDRNWMIQATPKPLSPVKKQHQHHDVADQLTTQAPVLADDAGIGGGHSRVTNLKKRQTMVLDELAMRSPEVSLPELQTTKLLREPLETPPRGPRRALYENFESEVDISMDGMTPPGVRFGPSHSGVIRTPAQRAARTIVSDLLRSAGGSFDDSSFMDHDDDHDDDDDDDDDEDDEDDDSFARP